VLEHIRAAYPSRDEPALDPSSVSKASEDLLTCDEFASCGEEFCFEVKTFMDGVARKMATFRKRHGCELDIGSAPKVISQVCIKIKNGYNTSCSVLAYLFLLSGALRCLA